MDTAKGLVARLKASSAMRAWKRYGDARGGLLAGGVTYFAFFSLFPAIALGFTIFGLVLRGHPGMLSRVQDAIDRQLPGFVKTDANPDGLIPMQIPTGSTLSITAIIGVLGLLWAGLGWLSALRDGIRAIFGVSGQPGNFVMNKLRDLGVLATLGLGVVLVAVLNGMTSAVASTVASWIGLGGQTWIVTLAGLVVSVLANGLLVALMLRVLSGVDLPWRALRNGAIFGGVVMTFLQTFGTRLIAGTMHNKLFASIALVVGLLAFLNLIARGMLLSAAWAANDIDDINLARATTSAGEEKKLAEGPATRDQAAAEWTARAPSALPQEAAARAALGLPTLDQRAADRTSVAAGAVLGAAATAVAGLALRATRSLSRR
ncbi:MAG: YihY/virulence factor BrkB family protein [Dermatophilaceae bacterium]